MRREEGEGWKPEGEEEREVQREGWPCGNGGENSEAGEHEVERLEGG